MWKSLFWWNEKFIPIFVGGKGGLGGIGGMFKDGSLISSKNMWII